MHRELQARPRVLLYTTGFYMGCDIKTCTCKIRISYGHRHGYVHKTHIKRGICGGLSQCSSRYARANNKHMQSCDPSKPSTYLDVYFDVNNLYGWAMYQSLSYADFRWIDDVENFDVTTIVTDSSTLRSPGRFRDVEDMQHLHNAHTDLLFCSMCEKFTR